MPIRPVTAADVPRILELLQQRRETYQHYAPVFWRIAERAVEKHDPFIRGLVDNADVLTIVHESNKRVDGVLIATLIDAPPVYDPGGKVCMIDDYVVESPELWREVGIRLLGHCHDWARAQGGVLQIIVCAQKDMPKAAMLKGMGAEVASEWYVREL
ncbi:hypothetical protein C2W62_38840 [Candidatus Entotheonella serta]|nr:hypothetical protein C2W62_38840 [Candidatus Entotheonella serta]